MGTISRSRMMGILLPHSLLLLLNEICHLGNALTHEIFPKIIIIILFETPNCIMVHYAVVMPELWPRRRSKWLVTTKNADSQY